VYPSFVAVARASLSNPVVDSSTPLPHCSANPVRPYRARFLPEPITCVYSIYPGYPTQIASQRAHLPLPQTNAPEPTRTREIYLSREPLMGAERVPVK
jgi:hypothetical protein